MNVAILNKYGYKISNIQEMSAQEISKRVVDLSQQDIDNEHLVDNLVMSMMEMDEIKFNKIISSSFTKHGVEYTFENLLFKFLEKTGILWQTGSVYPVQEHFITQLIRQKLILAIDDLPESSEPGKTFLMFLPENEYHEIGLLYLNFITRKSGHKVIYLGQNVPLVNLNNALQIHKVDFLLLSVASHLPEEDVTALITELNTLYPDKKIMIGGNCLLGSAVQLPANFILFKNTTEFTEFIEKL